MLRVIITDPDGTVTDQSYENLSPPLCEVARDLEPHRGMFNYVQEHRNNPQRVSRSYDRFPET